MAQNNDEKKLLNLLARLVRVADPNGGEIAAALLAQPEVSAAALGCAVERIEALRDHLDGAIAPELGLRLKERQQAAKSAKKVDALVEAQASLLRASWQDAEGGFQLWTTALFAVCAMANEKFVAFISENGAFLVERAKMREVASVLGQRATLEPYALLTKEFLVFRFGAKGQLRFRSQTIAHGESFFVVSLASLQDAPLALPAPEVALEVAPQVAPQDFGFLATLGALPTSPFGRGATS